MNMKVGLPAIGSLAVVAAAIAGGTPSASAQPGGFQCPPLYGQVVHITVGDIDCRTAADFGVQYDQWADKYQQIGPFNCYSGNAMTMPLLFTCVADTAEFAVYPA